MTTADGTDELRRSGTVAIVGRPNVGKSTLLNAALEMSLAIVSSTPQTTRDAILGVVHHEGAEIALLDTPGLHQPKHALGRSMNRTAWTAAQGADVIVFVTDVPQRKKGDDRPIRVHKADRPILRDLDPDVPKLLVVNKVDLISNKSLLLPFLEEINAVTKFESLVPISARKNDGVTRVMNEVAPLCPEGPARFEPDTLTDRPARFFAAEYVREQILHATREEIPHACAVTIDSFDETSKGPARIAATIHVERAGQKKILIGSGGEVLKRIGSGARQRIAELMGRRVHLELFVRVTEGWRRSPAALTDFGYEDAASGDAPSGKPKRRS